jgi:hypothetical protein
MGDLVTDAATLLVEHLWHPFRKRRVVKRMLNESHKVEPTIGYSSRGVDQSETKPFCGVIVREAGWPLDIRLGMLSNRKTLRADNRRCHPPRQHAVRFGAGREASRWDHTSLRRRSSWPGVLASTAPRIRAGRQRAPFRTGTSCRACSGRPCLARDRSPRRRLVRATNARHRPGARSHHRPFRQPAGVLQNSAARFA